MNISRCCKISEVYATHRGTPGCRRFFAEDAHAQMHESAYLPVFCDMVGWCVWDANRGTLAW